jgi:uncharacterized protein (DUF58 family)
MSGIAVEPRWRASPLTLALCSCAAVTLAAAMIGQRWQLVIFAAPLIGVLASVVRQPPPPRVWLRGHPDPGRCFEGEEVRVTVTVSADPPGTALHLRVDDVSGAQVRMLEQRPERVVAAVSAHRWGATRCGPGSTCRRPAGC